MILFQYAIILNAKDDEPARILVPPTNILAKDSNQANILAARAIPEEYLESLELVDIAVRPF